MMNGGVAELACRDRLRSRDIKEKNRDDDDVKEEEVEEERKMDDYKKVKIRKTLTADLEKEKRRKLPINLEEDDVEVLDKKAKNKGEKRIHGGDNKTKYGKASTTTFERDKNKKSSSHGRADHDKDKRRSTLLPLDKNKDSLKEKSRKMHSTHRAEKKLHSGDQKDKRKRMHSKYFEKDKKEVPSSYSGKNKIRIYDYVKHKGQSKPHPFNNNEMQKNEMKKKKNRPLDQSRENKIQTIINNMENKRKKTTEMFNKRKKMRTEDKDEKAWSGDRWKTKNTMQGYNKEQKVQTGREEKRNVPPAFIKLVYNNNFKEFLLIPPVVAPKLKDLTNHLVNLEDSEGKISNVKLSLVDGSLAFYEGWDNFVSDHLIKIGDILLFEYTTRSQFSVRVFGMDSCERVCFSVERQGEKKWKGCHAPDETENVAKSLTAVSGARCVAVNSKEYPNRVVSGVEHGSSIALCDTDGYLANGKQKHEANDIFQTWSKGTRNSEVILIIDDEAPLTQANEDIEKLKTLHEASETHCVTDTTKEDPKGVASGALCGPSVALNNKEGTLAIGECKTNCISSICSTKKTIRSEIIPVIDASPLAQENDDVVQLKTFPLHIEETNTMKGAEPEIATPTKCTEIQDSNEDLRRKQEGNTVQLECATTVDKSPNNSKMNTNGNICRNYEVTGGSPSLEKWKKATVSGRAALDDTVLSKPEKLLKTEDRLAGNCSSVGVNSPSLEKWRKATVSGHAALDGTGLIKPEKLLKTEEKLVDNCSSMGVNSPSLEKWKKATVSGRAALDGTGRIKPEKLLKTEDRLATVIGRAALDGTGLIKPENVLKTEGRLVDNCSSMGVNSPSLEKWKKATLSGRAALDGTGLIKPEKLLKTEDRLVGNCNSLGVSSEKSLQGYAGQAALDGTGLIRPEKRLNTYDKLVGNCSAKGVNPVEQSLQGYAGTYSCVQHPPSKISKSIHIKTEIDLFVSGKGPTVQPKTQMEQFEPMGSIACKQQMNNIPARANHAVARLPEHHFFNQEDRKASHHVTPGVLLPVKVEELDDHSVLKTNLQFCIPSTTQTWLELPSSLSNALRRKGRQDRNVIMLKDPMKRLWPVFYHENSLFVGFARGWKPFVAANNLQTGDVCLLLKDLDEDEPVYHVQITRR